MALTTCTQCNGTGLHGDPPVTCDQCRGIGQVDEDYFGSLQEHARNQNAAISANAAAIADVMDKCNDIMEKCNEIKEVVDAL